MTTEIKILYDWLCCLNRHKRKDKQAMNLFLKKEEEENKEGSNGIVFHRDLYNFSYARAWAVAQGLVFIRHESRKNV